MLGLLWLDVLTILDGLILLVGYFVYLGICMATRSSAGAAGSQRAGSTAQQYLAVPQQQPSQQQQYQQQMTDGELELVPFTLAIDDSGSPTGAADPATVVKSVRQAPPGTTPPLSPRLPPGAFEKRRVRSVAEGLGEEAFSHHYQQQQPPLDGLPKAASLPTHLPPAIGAPPGVSGWSGGGNRSLREAIKAYIRDLPAALEDCLHLHGKTGLRRWFGLATAPLVLFMHATMPAVGTGEALYTTSSSHLIFPGRCFYLSFPSTTLNGCATRERGDIVATSCWRIADFTQNSALQEPTAWYMPGSWPYLPLLSCSYPPTAALRPWGPAHSSPSGSPPPSSCSPSSSQALPCHRRHRMPRDNHRGTV